MISYIPYVKKSWVLYETFPNRKIPSKIKEIGNEASETTRTYQVTLIHDQPEDIRILPGMAGEASGEVQLPDDLNKKGIEVPASAIFSRGEINNSYVWVIDEKPRW